MKRHQLEHIIGAAASIAEDDDIVVIGSQAILGQFPDAADDLLVSMEADVYPRNHPERADLIDGIGIAKAFAGRDDGAANGSAQRPSAAPFLHSMTKERSAMRLAEFIEQEHDKIIEEWVAFAATLLPWAKGMDEKDLRDHAEELLAAVVRDMKSPQTGAEQAEKSKGRSVEAAAEGDLACVGQRHASERLKTGFKLHELVSEYRALRASVLRLWAKAQGEDQSDMTRFNEAIDESLTVATNWYSEELNRTREQFLAILGHDLRNPLSAIVMGAQLLTKSESRLDDEQLRVAKRIASSAGRMDRMVSDLLDLTRTRLGGGIPVTPKPINLPPVCHQVISEFEASHPGHDLRFESGGDLHGEWDGDRLQQVLSNLVANALQHGGDDGRVSVAAQGHGEEVMLRVHNEGEPIPANALKQIFEPMVRQPTQDGSNRNSTGLGLGLYIAREIVTAHGGTISVTSTEQDGTAFTVKLPRHPPKRPTRR